MEYCRKFSFVSENSNISMSENNFFDEKGRNHREILTHL